MGSEGSDYEYRTKPVLEEPSFVNPHKSPTLESPTASLIPSTVGKAHIAKVLTRRKVFPCGVRLSDGLRKNSLKLPYKKKRFGGSDRYKQFFVKVRFASFHSNVLCS